MIRWLATMAASTVLASCCGCTSHQLRTSTTHQARTLTDTQYEQVLDNLAMFCSDPMALPSMITLRSGSTQVGDSGSLGFLGVAGLNTTFGSSPTISASRSVVDQWGTAPVTDDNELLILRKAYRTARGLQDFLSVDEANDIGHDLSQQIGTNADISIDTDTITELAKLYGQKRALTDFEKLRPGDTGFSGLRNALQTVSDEIVSTLDDPFLVLDDRKIPYFKVAFSVGADEDEGQEDPKPKGKPSTGLAKETARRVNDIQKELAKVAGLGSGWYGVGCKSQVPPGACFVGHYKGCPRCCRHRGCGGAGTSGSARKAGANWPNSL